MISIKTRWGPRADTPDQIAQRWLDLFPALAQVHAAFGKWWDFTEIDNIIPISNQADIFAARMQREKERVHPEIEASIVGYRLAASNTLSEHSGSQLVDIYVSLGSQAEYMPRWADFFTRYGANPDQNLFDFHVLRSILMIFAQIFEIDNGSVQTGYLNDLAPDYEKNLPYLWPSWISYVSPDFAHLIKPPPIAVVEILSNGGLIMAATTNAFDVDNPSHVRAAFDIAAGARAYRRPNR